MFKDPINLTPATRRLMEEIESHRREQDTPQGKRKKVTQGYGHKQSEETKKKIAESLRGNYRTGNTIDTQIRRFRKEGLTAPEMAERLNITTRSVQGRIYRMDNHLKIRTVKEKKELTRGNGISEIS